VSRGRACPTRPARSAVMPRARVLPYIRMSDLSRIGVAIATDLLGEFDDLIDKRGYTNRSEAFRDLIRAELVRESSSRPAGRVVGSLTVVYDHHVRLLEEKLYEMRITITA